MQSFVKSMKTSCINDCGAKTKQKHSLIIMLNFFCGKVCCVHGIWEEMCYSSLFTKSYFTLTIYFI